MKFSIFCFLVLLGLAFLTACSGGGGVPGGGPSLTPAIEPPTAPPGNVGVPYNLSFHWTMLTAKPPYFWNLIGSMPPGCTFDAVNGLVSGTPTTPGTYAFTMDVRDSSVTQKEESKAYTVVITGPIAGPLTVATAAGPLGNGKMNLPYSAKMTATGGLYPYTWTILSGSLPPVLSLNGSNGVISGTATTAGTFSFVADVADSQTPPNTATQAFSITIIQAFAVTTTTLPDAGVGVAYSQQLNAVGGVPCGSPPYTWALESGALPPGSPAFAISAAGVITGTPTAPGIYNFVVRATDCEPGPTGPETARKAFSITVDLVIAGQSLCVDGGNGDDNGGDGTNTRPFKTISHALAYTSANNLSPSLTRIAAIHIAGTASGPALLYNENITINASATVRTDVNLLGGYSAFCATRGTVPNAIIKGLASNAGPTVVTYGLTRNTWIELLEIDGSDAPSSGSEAIANLPFGGVPSSPTIARNIIRAGNASGANATSVGISDLGTGSVLAPASPLIVENTIYGGTGAANTFGVVDDGAGVASATSEIRDNTIDGGDPSGGGATTSAGVKSRGGAKPLIYDNVITGGTGASAYAVWVDPADADIARNIINCKGAPASASAICAGIYIASSSTLTSPVSANSINENRAETGLINARGVSTRGIWIDGSTATFLGNNVVYGGEGTSTSYGILAENSAAVTVGNVVNAPGSSNNINGGGCALNGTFDSYGIKSSSGSTVNSYFNTINGGCGTDSSNGIAVDPATGNLDSNVVNGGGASGTTQTSRGVWYTNSNGSITNNKINGGNGSACLAEQLVGPNMPTPETGNTHICGGQNSYGLRVESCRAGFVIENETIYGGDPTGPNPTTSTGLKLKNCNAEVRNNTIDGGSGQTATGIDVDPSNPNVHNNTIRGSQSLKTTTTARGAYYHATSGGTFGGPAGSGNTVTGALVTSAAHPSTSIGLLVDDNSVPAVQNNTIAGGQGGNTTGVPILGGSNPVLTGNTIDGGTASSASAGIDGDTGSWTGTFSGNTVSGGSCTGCNSTGIRLNAGTPAIGPNNQIDGGSGRNTIGFDVIGTANPTITANTRISGGTASSASVGMDGETGSWTASVSGNTISGGTCTGCTSWGISLYGGALTIGPSNKIDGGSGANTTGISVPIGGTANPTITGNTSISGGTAANSSRGIDGEADSWTGAVSGNTISGGSCIACTATGIRLKAGTPTIGGPLPANGNTINAGKATNAWGILFYNVLTDFRNNTISGGKGTGYDVDDERASTSGFLNGTGTVVSSPFNPAFGPPGTKAICSNWVLNPGVPTEILGDNVSPFDSMDPADSVTPLVSPGAVNAPAPGAPVFVSNTPGNYVFIASAGNCINFLFPGTAPALPQWPMLHYDVRHTGRSPYVGPSSPTIKWTFQAPALFWDQSPAIGADGTVYITDANNTLWAVNPTGTPKWSYYMGEGGGFGTNSSSPAIGSDGTIYAGARTGWLYAFNPNGSVRWRTSCLGRASILSSPTVTDTGVVYFGCYDGEVCAADAATGAILWSRGGHPTIDQSSPALLSNGNMVIGIDSVYAFAPNGTPLWSAGIGPVVEASLSIADDNTIYAAGWDGNLTALNPDGSVKWRSSIEATGRGTPGIAADGTVYVTSDKGNLYAINPDGSRKWASFLSSDPNTNDSYSGPIVDPNGTIYVGYGWEVAGPTGKFYAFNPDGTPKWTLNTSGTVSGSAAIAADGTLYFGGLDGKLYAVGEAPPPPPGPSQWPMLHSDERHTGRSPYVGPQAPNVKWTFQTTERIFASSAAIASDGTVYVGSGDDKFWAVNPDGSLKWKFERGGNYTPQTVSLSSPAIGEDQTVYIASNTGNFFALNPDGTIRWEKQGATNIYSSPTLSNSGVVYFNCSNGNLVAADALTGLVHWTTPACSNSSSPAIMLDGSITVGTGGPEIAVSSSGTPLWSAGIGPIVESSPAVGDDGTIYVAGWDSRLSALFPDGRTKWQADSGATGRDTPGIALDGTIYVTSDAGKLFAFNPDGTQRWNLVLDLPHSDESWSSPIVDPNGTIYVGFGQGEASGVGEMYAINPDGTVKWKLPIPAWVSTNPAIAADGTLYFGAHDGKLYAIR